MGILVELTLLTARVGSFLVALWLSVTSHRAYQRTGSPTFRYTTVGFVFLGSGLAVESLLLRTAPLTLTEIHTVESVVFAAGFAAFWVSLRGLPRR